jgi:hypothetical protein
MGHTMTVFFLLLGISNLLKFQKTEQNKYLWFSSLYIGLMGSIRFQDMVLMFIPISFLYLSEALKSKKSDGILNFILFWFNVFFITISLHLPFVLTADYQQQFSNFFKIGVSENVRGLLSPSLLRTLQYLILNFSIAGILSALIGLIYLIKFKPKIGIFCLLWIVVPLSFYGNLWSTAPRFFNICLPAIIIAQIYLISRLININKAFSIVSIFILIIITIVPFYKAYPKMKYLHTHALIPDFAHFISQNTESNAIIIPSDEGQFIEYFSHRKILYRPTSFFTLSKPQLEEFKSQLDNLLNQNFPIYITYDGLYSYNPEFRFSKMMKEHYLLETIVVVPFHTWHFSPFGGPILQGGLIKISKKT